MAKKRGFFAELQHQNQVAARQRQQQATAAHKAQLAAQKKAEAAVKQAQQAATRAQRASTAEQKAAEKEAQRLHLEARQAEVDALNADLASAYEAIDSILATTLAVDDYVDLETLRATAAHPLFQSELEKPLLPPPLPAAPAEPIYQAPPGEPSKLGGMFGSRKRWEEMDAQARQVHAHAHATWRREMEQLPQVHEQVLASHANAEQQRLANLAAARAQYEAECREREQDAIAANQRLDEMIQGLAYGVETAIQEYVSIVLGNSLYPEVFPVDHEYEFNSSMRELTLTALVPPPDQVPRVKEYKYVRAKDEIVETALPQKDAKERYRHAIAQVGVRTLHEIFEADRAARIGTIALTLAAETIDAGTGLMKRIPLVAVAAERGHFTSFDLTNVVPQATLETLGAQISKSPADLTPIDTSKGVRGR
jgi:restriction system protein